MFPYSGAVLAVNVTPLLDEPAVFEWFDEKGAPLDESVAGWHEVNDPFAEHVEVVGYGFRNIFGVALGPDGVPYTAMNGANGPNTQDVLYRLDEPVGTFYGFPHCFDEGPPGGTGNQVRKTTSPLFPDADCADVPTADAMLGWHTCTTGLDFPSEGPYAFEDGTLGRFGSSLYVGECTGLPRWMDNAVLHSLSDPNTHSSSHKVVRVELDAFGQPRAVRDFVTGLPAPTDVLFGPEGAMYVASVEGIHRVAPAL